MTANSTNSTAALCQAWRALAAAFDNLTQASHWLAYALACCGKGQAPLSPGAWAEASNPEGPAPQWWAQVDT